MNQIIKCCVLVGIITSIFVSVVSYGANASSEIVSQKTSLENVIVDKVTLEAATPDGVIIPVLCRFATNKHLEAVKFQISNKGIGSTVLTLSVQIRDWSNMAENTVELNGHESKVIPINLTFKKELYQNNEVVDAQIEYQIKQGANVIWSETKPIRIAAKGTMIWSMKQPNDAAILVAAFVNPHDPKVEEILAQAKERTPERKLIGYQLADNDEQKEETFREVKAIIGALAEYGLSYVNSPVSFAGQQRVRTPSESIIQKSANCIDGAVLYASLFENLGMEPLIILGPGHAFVGVKSYPNSAEVIFVETTMTNTYPNKNQKFKERLKQALNSSGLNLQNEVFMQITNRGAAEFQEWNDAHQAIIIDIKQARSLGIMPAFTE